MRWFTVVGLALLGAFACNKGGSGAKGSSGEPLGYDADGNPKPCPKPRSDCAETTEATLDFKDRCRTAGFSMQLCGCDELCMGNIVGSRKGYDAQNKEHDCEPPSDKCEMPDTSAAFQDACSEAGNKMMDCECQSLCSGKLNEALPEAPPPSEAKEGEGEGEGDKDSKDKKEDKKEDKKPRGNMDGEMPAKKGKK